MSSSAFDTPTAHLDDISGDYTIDPSHSRLGFVARHAMVTKVRGNFPEFSGTAHIDAADPSKSSVNLTIAAASVTTGSKDRDGHLTSADFFDVETYPELTFVSTSVERAGDDGAVTGDLTIKGTTKPVTITFEQTGSAQDPFGNVRVGFEGEVTVNRKDWDLTWNAALETGGVLVSEKVKLEFDISAIKAASIDTRNADRDGHLRSNDFFDMDTYPEITFVSTQVESVDDETYRVTGDLTIKGITKPVIVDFEYTGAAVDPFGNSRIGLEGKTTVNRKDWGISWNAALETGGVLVGEKVTLEFEVSAIRSQEA
jgi:polyisoprenoid-binding protein YceI